MGFVLSFVQESSRNIYRKRTNRKIRSPAHEAHEAQVARPRKTTRRNELETKQKRGTSDYSKVSLLQGSHIDLLIGQVDILKRVQGRARVTKQRVIFVRKATAESRS